eukprot:758328-Hanusia_phi.AAC.5
MEQTNQIDKDKLEDFDHYASDLNIGLIRVEEMVITCENRMKEIMRKLKVIWKCQCLFATEPIADERLLCTEGNVWLSHGLRGFQAKKQAFTSSPALPQPAGSGRLPGSYECRFNGRRGL